MDTVKPILDVYADLEATRRALVKMKVSAKLLSFASIFLAASFIYLIVNDIENFRYLTGAACLLLSFFAWATYHSIPSYEKEHRELPLLYSFYKEGFITHRSGHHVSWEQIEQIVYSKTNVNLNTHNLSNIVQMSLGGISPNSVDRILAHIKNYAPKRLSGKIKIKS